jgi:hypothetical protein
MATPTWLFSLVTRNLCRTRSSGKGRDLSSSNSSLVPLILRSKIFLYTLLVGCTLLVTQVGPASALLFTPAQLWIKASGTHFYMGGREDMLWPATLTSNHTGSERCRQSPLRMDFNSCLYGSWRVLLGAVTILRPVSPGFKFYIPGGDAYEFPPSALIYGNIPTPDRNFTMGDPDTWAAAPDLGVASHMDYLTQHTVHAFGHAQGWKKRLRDVGESRVVLTTGGRFPFVRTVCSARTTISAPPSKLDIPLLKESTFWRERVANSSGPKFILDLTDLNLTEWDTFRANATTLQTRARWIPMPSNIGAGSAIMIYLLQNSTAMEVMTCAVDARWATGQTMQSDRSIMWSWESQQGIQPFDPPSSRSDWAFERVSMFDRRYAQNYSKPITVEQTWLDALAPPMPEASLSGNKLIMNSFEALLNQSGLRKAGDWGNHIQNQIDTVKLE